MAGYDPNWVQEALDEIAQLPSTESYATDPRIRRSVEFEYAYHMRDACEKIIGQATIRLKQVHADLKRLGDEERKERKQ